MQAAPLRGERRRMVNHSGREVITPAGTQLDNMMSTRRFVARPLSVLFGASGSPSPAVLLVTRDDATPLDTR